MNGEQKEEATVGWTQWLLEKEKKNSVDSAEAAVLFELDDVVAFNSPKGFSQRTTCCRFSLDKLW